MLVVASTSNLFRYSNLGVLLASWLLLLSVFSLFIMVVMIVLGGGIVVTMFVLGVIVVFGVVVLGRFLVLVLLK